MSSQLRLRLGMMGGSGGPSTPPVAAAPVWLALPDLSYFENELEATFDFDGYVYANSASQPVTITNVSVTPADANITFSNAGGALLGDSRVTFGVGTASNTYTIVMDAVNATGTASPKGTMTATIAVGVSEDPPTWSDIPDFYSTENIPGSGETVPSSDAQISIYAAEGGVEMSEYVSNKDDWPIIEGSWTCQPNSTFDITPTGNITVKGEVPVATYNITVSCENVNGRSTSPTFTWMLLPEEGFFADFTLANLQEFDFVRPGEETGPNHFAVPTTAGPQIPVFPGARFNDPSWANEGVGYGLQAAGVDTDAGQSLANLSSLPSGMINNFSGQITVVWRQAALAGDGGNYFGRIYNEDDPNRNSLSFQIGQTSGVDYVYVACEVDGPVAFTLRWQAAVADGDVVSVKYRKSDDATAGEGLVGFLKINDVDHGESKGLSPSTYLPIDCSDPFSGPLDYVALEESADIPAREIIEFRLSAYALSNDDIKAWPTWTQPKPIFISIDPEGSLDFPIETPVDPSGSPTVSGQYQEGYLLTSDISGMTDPGDITNVTYQWVSSGPISGATESTYFLTADEVGLTVSVQVSYENTNGTPVGPISSLPGGPVTPAGAIENPTATLFNKKENNWMVGYGTASEGESAEFFFDAKDVASVEWVWSPGVAFQDRDTFEQYPMYQPVTASEPFAGITFDNPPIPLYDDGYDGYAADTHGARAYPANDQTPTRYRMTITNNAQLGDDCFFQAYVYGQDGSYKLASMRGMRYQVIGKRATSPELLGDLYAWWRLTELYPEHRFPNGENGIVHQVWTTTGNTNKIRDYKWISQYKDKVNYTLEDYDTHPTGYRLNWLDSLIGDSNRLLPNSPDTSLLGGWKYDYEHFVGKAKAAYTRKNVGKANGFLHGHSTPHPISAGMTIAIPDFRHEITSPGCVIQLMSAGSQYFKLFSDGGPNYKIQVGSQSEVDTGIPLVITEPVMLTVTIDDASVSVWGRIFQDTPGEKVEITHSHNEGAANIDAISLFSEADAGATNCVDGLWSSTIVYNEVISPTNLAELQRSLEWDLFYGGGALGSMFNRIKPQSY